jgi:hypothetical protein
VILKFLLKKRLIFIPLIIIIAVLAIGGIVLAANQLIIPGQANIVSATYDIEVYADPACTIPLTPPLTWSILPTGEKRSKTVYVKNVGNSDALITPTLQTSVSGVTLAPVSVTVPRGGSIGLSLQLISTPSASLGSASLTITLSSVQASQATTTTTTTPP